MINTNSTISIKSRSKYWTILTNLCGYDTC